jgi:membrane fusion protein (multidrug efflux system)
MDSHGERRPSGGRADIAARLFAALVTTALATAGCGTAEPEEAAAEGPSGPPPVTVEFLRIEPETLRDVATFSGQLNAEHSVVIRAETDGVLEAFEFAEGQMVKDGQVLFTLRRGEQEARLREAQANLALSREVYKRTQELVTRDASSLAQKDRALAELEVAKARVELAQLELERTSIRAPFDGVVGTRLVDPGDRITDDTPLVQIDAVDRLQVLFAISEQGVAFARLGASLEIRVLPYPGETFSGEVFFVSPTLDPTTRRMILKGWVPNTDGRLRAGLFANVDMEVATRENALLVPESAVVVDRHGAYVWRRKDDDTATRVPVELGLRKGGRVEVTMGLRPGDEVVVAGTHKVAEDKKLQAKPAVMSAPPGRPAPRAQRQPAVEPAPVAAAPPEPEVQPVAPVPPEPDASPVAAAPPVPEVQPLAQRSSNSHGDAWAVQIGASRADGSQLPEISLPDGKRLYRIAFVKEGEDWERLRVGFFASQAEASAAAERLDSQFPGAWVARMSSDERDAALPAVAVAAGQGT